LHTKREHAGIADACFMHVESWKYSYETFVAGIAIRLLYGNTTLKLTSQVFLGFTGFSWFHRFFLVSQIFLGFTGFSWFHRFFLASQVFLGVSQVFLGFPQVFLGFPLSISRC